MKKISLQKTILITLSLLIIGAMLAIYPPVKTVAQNRQIVQQIPVTTPPPKVIETYKAEVTAIKQISKKDSIEFIKAAAENDYYQSLLIEKVKKQEREIAELKRQNSLLKRTKIITAVKSTPVVDSIYDAPVKAKVAEPTKKKIGFWRRLFGKKETSLKQ